MCISDCIGRVLMNNKERNQVMKMLYLITQIGFTMVVTIFISMGIAYLINRKDFMVWFIVIGVLAGFRSVYILIRKFLNDSDNKHR